LISSFVQQTGTVIKPANARSEILKEASENLEKYLSSAPANKETKFYQEYLESVKFFALYYNRPENQTSNISEVNATTNDNVSPIKILSKPRPSYTDAARQSGIEGVVRLMIGFSEDGKIKHIMVVKPLSHGLNEEAVRAARAIKFNPATKDGKPVSVVKQIEYSFSIY
jgi:TonB family protein